MAGTETDMERPACAKAARGLGARLRRVGWLTLTMALASPLLLACGFVWFIWRLPSAEVKLDRKADGIVVLTGGSSRITDAMELLAAGYGRRLLISGANPTTNASEISRLNPDYARWVRCCVDFDQSLNTLGNAIETRGWVLSRGFRSLIVVTSSYHMPRAMAEIANQLPGVTLLEFPVISERIKAEPWWSSGATSKLLLSEYLKYLVMRVRISLNPAFGIKPA